MSVLTVTERIYHVTATCDQCGTVKTWDQREDAAVTGILDLGFDMTMMLGGQIRGFWFHEAACVHKFVEANVIEHLRYPEGAVT